MKIKELAQGMPKWVKVCLIIGALPIPGPFDEIAGAIALRYVYKQRRKS